MSLFASSSRHALRRVTTPLAAVLAPRPPLALSRHYATPSNPAAAEVAASSTPDADASSAPPEQAANKLAPSSCPAGTPMPGLSLLKDRPELIARPDDEYPSWLWDLLADPALKTTYASTDASELVAGVSTSLGGGKMSAKGLLRIQQKRELREKRAAAAAAERSAKNAKQKKGGAAAGTTPPIGEGSTTLGMAQGGADAAIHTQENERDRKRALRKANRDKIKTQNFVKAS